jgi:hypothetical protein
MMHKTTAFLLFIALFVAFQSDAHALNRAGRLGIGFTNQLKNDVPALSFKVQRSKSFAFGGMAGLNNADDGGYGAGLKFYRIIFDEPQLNFYSSAAGIYLVDKRPNGSDKSGFQFDLTFGSEFSFTGLNSLGFSIEFGLSLNKIDDFVVETVGRNFVLAQVHFYL